MEIREFTLTEKPKVYEKDKNGQPWQYGGVKVVFKAAECGPDMVSGFFPADHEITKMNGGDKISLVYEQKGQYRNVKPITKKAETEDNLRAVNEWITNHGEHLIAHDDAIRQLQEVVKKVIGRMDRLDKDMMRLEDKAAEKNPLIDFDKA